MGTGPGVNHRMFTHLFYFGIIPAAAQVIAMIIVGSISDPGRTKRATLLIFCQIEANHFPVRFVVIGTGKAGAPVVERVEVPILQYQPTRLTQDTTMIDVALLLVGQRLVSQRRRRRRIAWYPATSKEGERKDCIDKTRDVTDPCQPSLAGMKDLLCLLLPVARMVRRHFGRIQWISELQIVYGAKLVGVGIGESFQVELPTLGQLFWFAVMALYP